MIDRVLFRQAVVNGNIIWRKHALEKMLAREISRADALEVIEKGEIIRVYETDKPFPSALLFCLINERPIHVVIAFDSIELILFVITAYEPDLSVFEPDFINKRK